MCRVTRLDIIRNEYIRCSLGIISLAGKTRETEMVWEC